MSDLIDPPPLTADQPIPGPTFHCCRHCVGTEDCGTGTANDHSEPCADGCNWGQGVPA